jgi:MFS family permease
LQGPSRGEISLPTTAGDGRFATFRALQHRDFRILWTGLAVSAVGTWMQIVALSLLVLDLTHGSAAALGAVSLVQALSFLLFSAVGGGAADRFDKRRLLLLTQSIMTALALLLGILTAAGVIRFWMIPLFVFGSSATLSFDMPARNALAASLVPKEHLMNAVALQSAVFNGASILGPALAGLALSRIGYSGNFFLNAASYSAVLAALLLLRASDSRESTRPVARLWDSVREALHYVRQDALLPAVVSAYAALLFFGPSAALMLPLFARQVLRVGPPQLGMLFSAIGAGTVLSALLVASLGDVRCKGRLVFGSILLWMAALAGFGLSGSLHVAALALFLLGAAQNIAGATTITLLQTRVPPDMRGRAMSLNTLLIMCVRPLGDFPAGALVAGLGLRPTVLLSVLIVGVAWLTILAGYPAVRSA